MMKTCVSAMVGLWLFSSVSFAAAQDQQTELELEAMALVQLQQQQAVDADQLRSGLGGLPDLGTILQQVEAIKQQLLDQFDENGNGCIDPGPELDNFKSTLQSLVLVLVDSNQNGRIDLEDVQALLQSLTDQAKEKVLEVSCPLVKQEAERAGWWLQFRPVLKHFYDVCTFGA